MVVFGKIFWGIGENVEKKVMYAMH